MAVLQHQLAQTRISLPLEGSCTCRTLRVWCFSQRRFSQFLFPYQGLMNFDSGDSPAFVETDFCHRGCECSDSIVEHN